MNTTTAYKMKASESNWIQNESKLIENEGNWMHYKNNWRQLESKWIQNESKWKQYEYNRQQLKVKWRKWCTMKAIQYKMK